MSGEEVRGSCLFCGDEHHFSVNVDAKAGVWNCLKCGQSGNVSTFLVQVVEFWQKQTTPADYDRLGELRGLPGWVLAEAGIAFNSETGEWLIPSRNPRGVVTDIGRWAEPSSPGDKPILYVTKGCRTGIFGGELLGGNESKDAPVWVCEGWGDTLAGRAYAQEMGEARPLVIGMPGASVFKKEWATAFAGREVTLFYDNDKAGRDGLAKAYGVLTGYARGIHAAQWPDTTPEKTDIRDLYRAGVPLLDLLGMVRPYPFPQESGAPAVAAVTEDEGPRPSLGEVLDAISEHLQLTPELRGGVLVSLATVIQGRLPKPDPLWVFIVGSPGSGKTAILECFTQTPHAEFVSSLTNAALVSGFNLSGGDPSLLARVMGKGKTLVLKDFTEVLGIRSDLRQEILGTLRGAYDGRLEKPFGNGVTRTYHGYFGFLAGVTDVIHNHLESALGPRCLLYSVKARGADDRAVTDAALANAIQGDNDSAPLAQTVRRFLGGIEARPIDLPEWYSARLTALAHLTAALRAEVLRDRYSKAPLGLPTPEVPTRLVKQLHRLAAGLSLLYSPGEEDWDTVWGVVQKTALDTGDNVARAVAGVLLGSVQGLTVKDVAAAIGAEDATIRYALKDMALLGTVAADEQQNPSRYGGAPVNTYSLSGHVRAWCEDAMIRDMGRPLAGGNIRVRRKGYARRPKAG